MLYHEVSRMVFEGFKKIQRLERGEHQDRLFNEFVEQVGSLYVAIDVQYNLAANDLEPPNLGYRAPILGAAEVLAQRMGEWIERV